MLSHLKYITTETGGKTNSSTTTRICTGASGPLCVAKGRYVSCLSKVLRKALEISGLSLSGDSNLTCGGGGRVEANASLHWGVIVPES